MRAGVGVRRNCKTSVRVAKRTISMRVGMSARVAERMWIVDVGREGEVEVIEVSGEGLKGGGGGGLRIFRWGMRVGGLLKIFFSGMILNCASIASVPPFKYRFLLRR